MNDGKAKYPLTGGCQCGAVRYEIDAPPRQIYVCHCEECRKQSASASGISVIVGSKEFRIVQGTPKRWSRMTDSGRSLICCFCPDCGSRVWHGHEGRDATISVKGGSLDRSVDLGGVVHIWTNRMLPGVIIPDDSERHDYEPG